MLLLLGPSILEVFVLFLCISPFTWIRNHYLQNNFSLAFVSFSQKWNHRVENIACWNPNVLKYNNSLTQLDFTQRHFEHKTEQTYLTMSFCPEKHAETFISPLSIYINIASKAIRYMLRNFHNRGVVETTWHIIYAETMHDEWKQNPYPIWFLRRCDSKLSSANEVLLSMF